jgi:hypothetical protein
LPELSGFSSLGVRLPAADVTLRTICSTVVVVVDAAALVLAANTIAARGDSVPHRWGGGQPVPRGWAGLLAYPRESALEVSMDFWRGRVLARRAGAS